MGETTNSKCGVYISFSNQNKSWVHLFKKHLEQRNVSVYYDDANGTREDCIKDCSIIALIFSSDYLRNESYKWKYFVSFIKKPSDSSVKTLFESKTILCIILSACELPPEISNGIVLDFTTGVFEGQAWKKTMQIVENAKKKEMVKKALFLSRSKVEKSLIKKKDKEKSPYLSEALNVYQHNQLLVNKKENLKAENQDYQNNRIILDSNLSVISENIAYVNNNSITDEKDYSFSDEYQSKVLPHLITYGFSAFDEDLTVDDITDLTLKMEDIETIMKLNESDESETEFSKNPLRYVNFSSQYEQMHVLDNLQDVFCKFNQKVDCCGDVLRKRSYRRLLKLYNKCIMSALNGKKDMELLNTLPFINPGVDDLEDVRCCCCEKIFHSERALDIHVHFCIKSTWKEILVYSPK